MEFSIVRQTNSINRGCRIAEPHEWRTTCRCSAIGSRSLDREPTWAVLGRSVSLPRRRDRIHSAVPDCLGSARGGKKCDQSLRTFNVSRTGHDGG